MIKTLNSRIFYDGIIPILCALIGSIGLYLYQNISFGSDLVSGNWSGIGKDINGSFEAKDVVELNDSVEIKNINGSITGKIRAKDGRVDDLPWSISGFLSDDYISVAYKRDGENSAGIGNYLLENYHGGSTAFVGYWEGKDCKIKKIIRCPYVISRDSPDKIKNSFQEHLSKPCVPVRMASCQK